MLKIQNNIIRKQPKIWNNCLFHPTDAVEDPWGRRILDRMAFDGAIQTVRIYTMFEDIVYMDENGKLQYDFRLSDLRLDYLVKKGYDLILAYGGMPDCVASSTKNLSSVAKGKTRYKGKMWNSAPPRDYALWEEICYEYTKHIVKRYGIEKVSNWHCQCFNEPDVHLFFLSEYPGEREEDWPTPIRCEAYCKLYEAFEKGVRRASERIRIGGPALGFSTKFLEQFLDYIKENNLKMDYIALHNYGELWPDMLRDGVKKFTVANNMEVQEKYMKIIREHGFGNVEIVMDEWGACAQGFSNMEECPSLTFRETEIFSSFYAKFIYELVRSKTKISKLMICLSGQHEMLQDFTGFRNFFTLNFIAKPIYNAHIMTSKMEENLLTAETDTESLFAVPTKNDKGDYAVLLTYASECFEEDLPQIEETITFEEDITGKKVTVWCIDKNTTNPYRLYQKMGIEEPSEEDILLLRQEGDMKPVKEYIYSEAEGIKLNLTSNATYLIQVTEV